MILRAFVSAEAVADWREATASSGLAYRLAGFSVFAPEVVNGKANANAANKLACCRSKRVLETLAIDRCFKVFMASRNGLEVNPGFIFVLLLLARHRGRRHHRRCIRHRHDSKIPDSWMNACCCCRCSC
jgi:hypothetical protein